MSSCPVRLNYVDETNFVVGYDALEVFENLPLLRLGQGEELVEDWMEEEDPLYLVGVMGTAMVVSVVCLVWMVALFVCYRRGPYKMGLLSGQVPRRLTNSVNYSDSRVNSQGNLKGEDLEEDPILTEERVADMSTLSELYTEDDDEDTRSSKQGSSGDALLSLPDDEDLSRDLSRDLSQDLNQDLSHVFVDELIHDLVEDSGQPLPQEVPQEPPLVPQEPQLQHPEPELEPVLTTHPTKNAAMNEIAALYQHPYLTPVVDVSTDVSADVYADVSTEEEEEVLSIKHQEAPPLVAPPVAPVEPPLVPATSEPPCVSPSTSVDLSTASASTSSKYAQYRHYLMEAAGARPTLLRMDSNTSTTSSCSSSSPSPIVNQDKIHSFLSTSDDCALSADQSVARSVDTADYLLEECLADNLLPDQDASNSSWEGNLLEEQDFIFPPPRPNSPTPPLPLQSPNTSLSVIDTSFPSVGPDAGFLFQDQEDDENMENMQPAPAELPRSHFSSKAASRKRLLETYVQTWKTGASMSMSAISTDMSPPETPPKPLLDPAKEPHKLYSIPPPSRRHNDENTITIDPKKLATRLHRFRICTVLSCTLLIVSVLLLAMNGLWSLDLATQKMANIYNDELVPTTDQTLAFLQQVQDLQESVQQQSWNLLQLMNQHCPLVRQNLCQDLRDTSCNVTDVPLAPLWNDWLDQAAPLELEQMLQYSDQWKEMSKDILWLQDQNVESQLDMARTIAWSTCALYGLLGLLIFIILWGIALPSKCFFFLSSWWFASLYWILVVLAWGLGMGFLMATVLSVDACRSGPNQTVQQLFQDRLPSQSTSVVAEYWNYHLESCPEALYPEFVQGRVFLWADLLPVTAKLSSGLDQYNAFQFTDQCGTSSLQGLRQASSTLHLQVCMLTQALANVRRILACDQWYPIYQGMIEDAVCVDSTQALVWSSTTQVLVILLAFTIWTVRASFPGR